MNFQKLNIKIPVEIPVNFMILTGTGIPANRLILTGTGISPGSRSILEILTNQTRHFNSENNLMFCNVIMILSNWAQECRCMSKLYSPICEHSMALIYIYLLPLLHKKSVMQSCVLVEPRYYTSLQCLHLLCFSTQYTQCQILISEILNATQP